MGEALGMESVMATGRILTRNSARWGGAIAVAALIQSCWGPCAFQFCGSNMKATAGYNRGYRFQRYRLCFHSEHSRRQWKLHNCGCKICSHSSLTRSRTFTRCVCTGSAVWAQQLHLRSQAVISPTMFRWNYTDVHFHRRRGYLARSRISRSYHQRIANTHSPTTTT